MAQNRIYINSQLHLQMKSDSESLITLKKEFITQIKNLKLDAEIKAKDNITKFNESQWKIDEMASKPFDISLISSSEI